MAGTLGEHLTPIGMHILSLPFTPQAVLFDLDGVIIDTEPAYTRFWDSIRQVYFPNDLHFAHTIKGRTLVEILAAYFPDAHRQDEVRQALLRFEQQMDFPLISGALDFVRALRAQGIPTAVVTSSDRDKMQALHDKRPDLLPLFTAVYTAEEAEHSKPAPDCYLNAAARLGADISRCVVFEDSRNGLTAGQRSGAYVVALLTGLSAEEVAPLSDAHIDDFRGLDHNVAK